MKNLKLAAAVAFVFVAGIGVGHGARPEPQPAMYRGQDQQAAARALLDVALAQAGKNGSWERIGVGRTYYLGGLKAEGQGIFDALLGGKHADSDVFRIARVYQEAGEWDKAKPLFDRYLLANPKDVKDLAEVGAYYLLNGDRATAEQLFDRAYKIERKELWATLDIAGAYLGVNPQH
ncbi:MAG: tetratricopeptide repeat protein [Lysobacter sp.]